MSTSHRTIPVEDFFRNAEKMAFTISPDGKYIAWLAPHESRMNVFVQHRESGAVSRLTSETTRDISSLYWGNNTQVLYLRDVGGDENFQLFTASVDGNEARALTPFPGVQTRIEDILEDVDEEILIAMNKRVPQLFDVYRLNIVSGEMTLIEENPGNVLAWVTDHAGKVRMAYTSDGVSHGVLYRDHEGEPFRLLYSTNFRETAAPLFFDFNNEKLYVVSNRGRNTMALVLFNPATGTEEEVLFSNDEYDMQGLLVSKKRKCITGARFYSWKQEHVFIDDDAKAVFEDVQSKIPGAFATLTDCDKAEENYIVAAYSDRIAVSYYLYNAPSKVLTKLADTRPWLREQALADVKPISYSTRDGLTVHGYLTLPVGIEAKNIPVIIFPHGGPWVRDYWGFDSRVQFFANLGYGVLQMNYRGSTGYGRAFWEASFKQWGRAMQNDISDGVAWLIAQGIADPKRVCILGGSYGGYAVLAGLAFTPEHYCCGVDIVGVSNLFTFRKTIPEYWKPFNEMTNEMIGDPVADEELLRSVSPFFHAENITAPLLVFQGAKDPRVNIAESDQIVSAIRAKGIDVEYIVKDDEGHGFANEENKLEMYTTIAAFLKKHLE